MYHFGQSRFDFIEFWNGKNGLLLNEISQNKKYLIENVFKYLFIGDSIHIDILSKGSMRQSRHIIRKKKHCYLILMTWNQYACTEYINFNVSFSLREIQTKFNLTFDYSRHLVRIRLFQKVALNVSYKMTHLT